MVFLCVLRNKYGKGFMKKTKNQLWAILSVFFIAYAYRICFNIWYLSENSLCNFSNNNPIIFQILGCFVYIFGEALPLLTVFTIHLMNRKKEKNNLDADLYDALNDLKERSPSEKQQDEDDEKLREVKPQQVDDDDNSSRDLSALDD